VAAAVQIMVRAAEELSADTGGTAADQEIARG
jgi:hypothetical protein